MDNQQPSNNRLFYQQPDKGYGYIYKYTSPNNKHYIGQTINCLATRAKNITSGIGYQKCTLFWKAIQKYQFSNFQVEILEMVPINELNTLEQQYIKRYNSLQPNGYNLTIGGDAGKMRDVYVYSAQNGKFLEHYNSLTEASNYTGVPIETISAIMSNNSNRKIAHNLIFFNELLESFDVMKLARKNYHAVYVYDIYGNYLNSYMTIADASRQLKISISAIIRHLTSQTSICNLYLRDEKTDKIVPINKPFKIGKIVRQIDPNTLNTVALYPSIAAAIKAVGLASNSSITRAMSRGGKAKGFYWQIIEGSTTTRSENPTETARDSQ